jgi:hypothetical protein
MDTQEAGNLLRDRLAEYRRLPYPDLAARVRADEQREVVGPSGVRYQTEIQVVWDSRPGGAVRVLGSIDDGGWRAFLPLCDSFAVARDGTFLGERPAEPPS